MTVGELIEKLQALDPSTLVVLAADAEGNDYRQLHELGREPPRPNEGDPYLVDPDVCQQTWLEEGDEHAVVLWPQG